MKTATKEKKVAEPVVAENRLNADLEAKVRNMAFKQAGGVPKNYSHTKVIQVNTKSFRVNIYTQIETENFMKLNKISHSFFLTVD
jgi:hypothetical protein